MLAQAFKQAEELGCSEEMLRAAITVLGMLERGELIYVDVYADPLPPNGFNMGVLERRTSCGTVACIGGWIEVVLGERIKLFADKWYDLFCPREWGASAHEYTVDRCAKALRAKLTTGKADWS